MDHRDNTFDSDALLAHVSWVRRLAHSLVPADAALAEDLAQDACLAALQRKPSTDRSLAAWLAGAVNNLLRQERRDTGRRLHREQRAARPEAQGDHDDTLTAQHDIVEAVMALEEPYRSTIVLRYFEELRPTTIARRQRVPVATVKTRLSRALEELRRQLDRKRGGDGRSWVAALVPFCRPEGVHATTMGALMMSTKLKVAVVVAIACGLAAVFAVRRADPIVSGSLGASTPTLSDPGAHVSSAPLDQGAEAPQRASALALERAPAPASVAESAGTMHGRVLDALTRPVPGVRVLFSSGHTEISSREFRLPAPRASDDSAAATTQAGGAFEMSSPPIEGELFVNDERWTTVLSSRCGPKSKVEHVIVVAPRLFLAGRVVDQDGRELAGSRIEIQLPRNLRPSFAQILDESSERAWYAQSDARGRFELDDAPRVDGALLLASADGFPTLSRAAPLAPDRALEIVLRRPDVQAGAFAGQVVDESGRAVAGAQVSLGHQNACTSDERGLFQMPVPARGERDPWVAVKPELGAVVQSASAAVKSGVRDPSEFVVLRLTGQPRTITGHLVDADAKPQAGWRVFLSDPTFFSAADEVPVHLEGLLSGAAQRAQLEQLMEHAQAGSAPEDVLRDTSNVFWTFVTTDAAGAFEISGLLPRSYRLSVLDPRTLVRAESEPIDAGSRNVIVSIPRNVYVENVRGQVLTADGKPLPGVKLVPAIDVVTAHIDAQSWSTFDYRGREVVTDEEGRFSFAELPREKAYLRVGGPDVVPIEWGRGEMGLAGAVKDRADHVVIRVETRCHFRIEAPADLADSVSVLDAQGESVQINVFEGSSRTQTDELALSEGRSQVLVVSSTARTLVLRKASKEVRRVPLALVTGEVNIVRL